MEFQRNVIVLFIAMLRGSGLVIFFRIQFFYSYDKAIQLNPNYTAAWNNKGIALRNLGRC